MTRSRGVRALLPSTLLGACFAAALSGAAPALAQRPYGEREQPRRDTAVVRDSVRAERDSLRAVLDTARKPTPPGGRWGVRRADFNLPFTTFGIGGGFLLDFATYDQDADSHDQIDLITMGKIRDSRILINGQLKTKRKIDWSLAFFYDMYAEKWLIRQTGFVVHVPEIHSNFWIGRSKEGPSLNRVMVGYDGWTLERFTMSDAAIPLLADGIRWQGYVPEAHVWWNVGGFIDRLTEGESFSYFNNQVAGRFGYVRMDTDTTGRLLHLGLDFQVGSPNEGALQLKSRPESFSAPNFVDSGKIPSTSAVLGGIEAYYRNGPLLFGTEYYAERVKRAEIAGVGSEGDDGGGADVRAAMRTMPAAQRADSLRDPVFHGGDVSVVWNITGETRRYIALGSTFDAVSPRHSVFGGGPGAWEAVLRLSYIDLDDAGITGGTFWRLTPMVNWHLSDGMRLSFAYGYGVLDRFGVKGGTHFYQARLQTWF
jgi:phosphate-selective porin OprO and OprP